MDIGQVVFFIFLGAIIIVPQVLRYKERERLHQTLRIAFERGQPVPPEVLAALQWRRRRSADWDLPPDLEASWRMQTATPAQTQARPDTPASDPAVAAHSFTAAAPPPAASAFFPTQPRRDFRRGLLWMALGVGLLAAGGAFYAGLYEIGGAAETLSLFSALAAVPLLVGLTYLALSWAGRSKTKG